LFDGFAEALAFRRKEQMQKLFWLLANVNFARAYSALISSPMFLKTKKGENDFVVH
jgi:hypothetical protein